MYDFTSRHIPNSDQQEIRNDGFTMINYGDRVTVTTWFGVTVEFKTRVWTVNVHIPECYRNVMEGLCGNYNGDLGDECTARDGKHKDDVDEFGESWKTDDAKSCGKPEEPKEPDCTDWGVNCDFSNYSTDGY